MAEGGQQWAWLGLLKWSLSYSDGTSDTPAVPMDLEKRAFLEAVMKDGILDENERMKEILGQMTTAMEVYQRQNGGDGDGDEDADIHGLLLALVELRDIVEQIDYARAFCSLQGLPFLLGCIQEREAVPEPIRMACLAILATLCQNNPPVQLQLLDLGSIKILSDLFFADPSDQIKFRIMQAMSANVRNHETAETVFSHVDQACDIFEQGLRGGVPLQKRTLFFLRALITSDTADLARVRLFSPIVAFAADHFLHEDVDFEIRELTLEFINLILEQKKSVNFLLGERRNRLVGVGVSRVSSLRKLEGEDREAASHELEEWEKLIRQLARAEPDTTQSEGQGVLLIGTAEQMPESLPQ
jgi:hsp70-interacting protein